MPATTPSGWRSEWLSTPVPTFSVISPFRRCGAPSANSTTSRPRVTSPLASSWVLAVLAEITSASWSARSQRDRLEPVRGFGPGAATASSPGRQAAAAAADGAADFGGRGEGDGLFRTAGGRIENGLAAARCAGDAGVVDEWGRSRSMVLGFLPCSGLFGASPVSRQPPASSPRQPRRPRPLHSGAAHGRGGADTSRTPRSSRTTITAASRGLRNVEHSSRVQ